MNKWLIGVLATLLPFTAGSIYFVGDMWMTSIAVKQVEPVKQEMYRHWQQEDVERQDVAAFRGDIGARVKHIESTLERVQNDQRANHEQLLLEIRSLRENQE